MSFSARILMSSLLLSLSLPLYSFELVDAVIPPKLKKTYDLRQVSPEKCISEVSQFISDRETLTQAYTEKLVGETSPPPVTPPKNHAPQQLLAFCHSELEQYQESLALLVPLLNDPSISSDDIRTLHLLATEIPEKARPEWTNDTLLDMTLAALKFIELQPNFDSPELVNILHLSVTKLALETHQYQLANQSLNEVRKHLKGDNKSNKLIAWLTYYYGHYYDQINQHQLAISHFKTANTIAENLQLTNLSSLVKESLSNLYREKNRLTRAIDFASQRVELLAETDNYTRQADSLIKFSALKKQNKEFNVALIYLFNALDIIEQKDKKSLAKIYLEIGRTYASIPYDLEKNATFAQKYLQNSRRLHKKLQNRELQTESLLLLAQINIRHNETALAILQLERVLTLAKSNFPRLRVKAFEMLALSYELAGDHQQANFHFKNFNSLQNTMKEKQFKLQQLKIDEQFQLIEQTQQQIQLETENNQLLLKNNYFKNMSYRLTGLFVFSVTVILFLFIRNKKISKNAQKNNQKMRLHPRTGLPLYHVQLKNGELKYKGAPLYYALVEVPFLRDLNESLGPLNAINIEAKLGHALAIFFSQQVQVSQVRDNQLLFISEKNHYQNEQEFTQCIEVFFLSFAENYGLSGHISAGVVEFPFLNNVRRAISPLRILSLSSLALFGACQLRNKVGESSWLKLEAIDKIQPAFFDGDLWSLGQTGIDKGIVKVKSSHPSTAVDWPALQ